MTHGRLEEILGSIRSVRVGILGDFCLDAYWQLDEGPAELSLETGKPTRGVRAHRTSLGGAGNVAANVSALGADAVQAFGVLGTDMFARELVSLLGKRGVDTAGMAAQAEGWDTPVYAKPYLAHVEQERIDFGRWNRMTPETESALIGKIRSALPRLGALVVNQQLLHGVATVSVVNMLNETARDHPRIPFILDSRTMRDSFAGMICKLNAAEATRLAGLPGDARGGDSPDALRSIARAIGMKSGRPAFVTRGAGGILIFDGNGFIDLPAIPLPQPIDTVGAGDTTVSAIAASLAAGASLREAGEMGNLAASVTVKKLRETGTATPEEILEAARTYMKRSDD